MNAQEKIAARLAEIRARLAASTPGPWKQAGTPDKPCPSVSAGDPSGCVVHSMLAFYDQLPTLSSGSRGDTLDRWNGDADLIAHAPDDLRYLLVLVDVRGAILDGLLGPPEK